jgi:hypothetical protein
MEDLVSLCKDPGTRALQDHDLFQLNLVNKVATVCNGRCWSISSTRNTNQYSNTWEIYSKSQCTGPAVSKYPGY